MTPAAAADVARSSCPAGAGPVPQPQPTSAGQDQDLAALLTAGLNNIQQAMGGMEARLSGKIDLPEASVTKNKQSIVVLTDLVNKNALDFAKLETEMHSGLEQRVTEIVRSQAAAPPNPVHTSPGAALGRS